MKHKEQEQMNQQENHNKYNSITHKTTLENQNQKKMKLFVQSYVS